jgi:DnaJ-domain-containing protein 1
MADKVSQVKKHVRDADDLFHLFTGKRFRQVFSRGLELFGEEIEKVFEKHENDEFLAPDNPYRTLGVEPDALDIVIKGAFRALVREYHPDTGQHSDTQRFAKVVEAYNAIMQARAEARTR